MDWEYTIFGVEVWRVVLAVVCIAAMFTLAKLGQRWFPEEGDCESGEVTIKRPKPLLPVVNGLEMSPNAYYFTYSDGTRQEIDMTFSFNGNYRLKRQTQDIDFRLGKYSGPRLENHK